MIKAMIFDLDGILVQTERLEAISYARAAIELCPDKIQEEVVIEAFKEVVGLSRREVAMALVEQFNLTKKAREQMEKFSVSSPWQAFVQVRLYIYGEMLATPQVIRDNQWVHNIALLNQARQSNCRIGLATMSTCEQAQYILKELELAQAFDFVASRDDVVKGKPDPEIYLMVSDELGVIPSECMVIEDSPTGVKAALNAGMQVVAVSTPFTQKGLRDSKLLPTSHIVDNSDDLPSVVAHVVEHFNL